MAYCQTCGQEGCAGADLHPSCCPYAPAVPSGPSGAWVEALKAQERANGYALRATLAERQLEEVRAELARVAAQVHAETLQEIAPTVDPCTAVWGIRRAPGHAVLMMPSEAAARAHAADPTRGGEVVRYEVSAPPEEADRG